jgi:ABC-type transporter Mla subunit MlaD
MTTNKDLIARLNTLYQAEAKALETFMQDGTSIEGHVKAAGALSRALRNNWPDIREALEEAGRKARLAENDLERAKEALDLLIDHVNDSDAYEDGIVKTSLVRQIAEEALEAVGGHSGAGKPSSDPKGPDEEEEGK